MLRGAFDGQIIFIRLLCSGKTNLMKSENDMVVIHPFGVGVMLGRDSYHVFV